MNGARALASGMLFLAAICAVPAVSAAQDAGTPAATTTTATTPAPPVTTTTVPDAPPAGASSGGRAPDDVDAVPDSSVAGSPAAPAAAPAAVASVASARKSASSSVTIVNFAFSPATITINAGDTVTWRNNDQAPHNATASDGSFSTPTLNQGESASHTFSSAGTFSYICSIHPNMHGTVRVLSASGSTAGSTSSGSSGTSESSAVASPDAAGTSTTLPMTGMAVGALALVGAALLASGLLTRWAGSARHWLSPF